MTSVVTIVADYMSTATACVDLSPKTWDDVQDWYIKWDTLHVKFEGDWKEFDLFSEVDTDIKRPARVDVYEGFTYDDNVLATQEGF
jgi:nitrate reductase beta subunit